MDRKRKAIALSLAGVAGSLLLVGVVSMTPIRHGIQVVPILAVLGAVVTRRRWAPYAAMPLFGLWLLLMGPHLAVSRRNPDVLYGQLLASRSGADSSYRVVCDLGVAAVRGFERGPEYRRSGCNHLGVWGPAGWRDVGELSGAVREQVRVSRRGGRPSRSASPRSLRSLGAAHR